MIGIHESDRDVIRFLWFDDPHCKESEIVFLRFTLLVFGLRSSLAILGAVTVHHIHMNQEKYPVLADSLELFYMYLLSMQYSSY